MSDFRMVRGFEDVWRPPVRSAVRRPETSAGATPAAVRRRLARIVAGAPEVMVKVTGRTRDPRRLAAHLTYISRNGALAAEDRDGCEIAGRAAVAELARDWADAQLWDSRRRANTPFSIGLILSMPAGTDPIRLRDSARAFAAQAFGERFDYVFVVHTDAPHPHAHLTLRALGDDGARLNPKKADLEAWRQRFAQCLRDHGVEAEATPRRARGVTRKGERTPLRKLRERAVAGRGPHSRTLRSAYQEAARLAVGAPPRPTVWEDRMMRRQRRIRALYLAAAALLRRSPDTADQALAKAVEDFVRGMPSADTRRLALARQLRAAHAKLRAPPSRDRSRDGW